VRYRYRDSAEAAAMVTRLAATCEHCFTLNLGCVPRQSGKATGPNLSALGKQMKAQSLMAGFPSWRSYQEFERSVRCDLRYVRSAESEEFLNSLLITASPRTLKLEKGLQFWRAQLGNDWREERQDDVAFQIECAFPKDRMKPRPDRASEGRVNPKGISCLYLATTKETAISEVRPWVGSHVSIGVFKLLRQLSVINWTPPTTGRFSDALADLFGFLSRERC